MKYHNHMVWSLEHQDSGLGRMEVQSILGYKEIRQILLEHIEKIVREEKTRIL